MASYYSGVVRPVGGLASQECVVFITQRGDFLVDETLLLYPLMCDNKLYQSGEVSQMP